jgi:hypothetical protein
MSRHDQNIVNEVSVKNVSSLENSGSYGGETLPVG